MKKFIFDVDGTLTPSRGKIDPEFAPLFMHLTSNEEVYLVTGSDRQKTLEQVTPEISNTNEASSGETETLRTKFQSAFSKENIKVTY